MRIIAFILLLYLLVPSVYADDQPVIYSRAILKIIPKPAPPKVPPPKEEKKEETSKPSEILPELPRVTKEFNVEVRPLTFLAQKDFIAHQPFTDTGGMLILIDPPEVASLTSANLLAHVDVLFIMEDGLITKIAPDLSLPGLTEPIGSEKPLHAFLFLKAGTAKASDIKPGDHVASSMFRAHPVVLE